MIEPMIRYEIERFRRDRPYTMPANHFHDHYEIYYLLSGKRYYFIQDRSYFIQEGDLVFIDRNKLHKTLDADIAAHERILVSFNDRWLHDLSQPSKELALAAFRDKQRIFSLKGANRMFAENVLFTLLREQQHKQIGWELSSQALLTQLLVFCTRLIDSQEATDEQPQASHPKIFEIVAYINEHYQTRLSLATISDKFHISPSYFCRSFKVTTGFSFVEYLNSVRVREAQRLLRETKMKVIDIAEQAGFESVAHFGRVFKQVTSQTPMACRKMTRV
ncbi:AraC family transcriptional regulator [Paenibacillus whitsoniae]|uniref:AraC family transcriptional regulator n=1 Tax=Paenibacillus whitsoniae TaxID=2496558 RepID=A0A3S0CDK8_9BACL|nr:helix-turn-helix domain-containing protein [Paenibacillus whitsoniae]RTE11531.1 AraC family transcriptional regulator [Paenibacillus whitsoniae]